MTPRSCGKRHNLNFGYSYRRFDRRGDPMITVRCFIPAIATLIVLLPHFQVVGQSNQPNIVYILVDNWGWGH